VNGWSGIAYHFYVEKNGRVSKGRDIDWRGGHTSGYNGNSIGVCFEGNFETEEMGEAQLAAGKELIAELAEQYPKAKIICHKDVNGTACPGINFPFDELTAIDEKPSEWAKEDVQKWIGLGILQGDLEGKYGFKEPVTLERMIVLIERRLNLL
jgi:N-acetyl-anhydromuramyl-L-alanine amidase AmpD